MGAKHNLLKYLEKKNISKADFYRKTGLSNGFLDKNDNISSNNIETIISFFGDISPEWIITGAGEMLRTVSNQNVHNSTRTHYSNTAEPSQAVQNQRKDTENILHRKGIPLIPVEAMAGYGSGDAQVMDYDIQENYIITPELEHKGVAYLIRASGSSMQPKYNNGDILACRPITDISFMQWGKVYVLDTDQGPLVKRLYQCNTDDDCLECHSDNFERYPPFKINKTSIRRIAIVVGVLRLE